MLPNSGLILPLQKLGDQFWSHITIEEIGHMICDQLVTLYNRLFKFKKSYSDFLKKNYAQITKIDLDFSGQKSKKNTRSAYNMILRPKLPIQVINYANQNSHSAFSINDGTSLLEF
ncbi:hypothetical protein BpHYR1_027898 [Brachionus plicatilis]|uniref:Uncharacterized protein n=1 Tax=Brachionus plicatilis TaxID=10195 RepID=A0A3M7QZN3_BRAPC|nr:hypothetical protein BpHYR1_027898 [Brachionus plicatilis]